MFTLDFWTSAAERAVKTFAQALAAILSTGGIGLLDVDWRTGASVAGMAALLSVLTSVASLPVGEDDNPSAVREHGHRDRRTGPASAVSAPTAGPAGQVVQARAG